ncbi:MAG: CvpA family protein [Flavobacteriales bacterium]|nr:CvpA family protein [Flavobacteriales bacterium]MCB9449539.1 CvpA family protein [Flavobacteriales bacterium]
MNWLDLVLIIPLLWAGYRGFTKGLLISLATFMALFLGIVAAIRLSDFVAGYLTEWWDIKPDWLNLIAFSCTFLLVVIGVHLFARLLEKMVKWTGLGWANKLTGALFGLMKMGFILSLLLMCFQTVNSATKLLDEDLQSQSLLFKPVRAIAPIILPKIEDNRISDMIHWDVNESKGWLKQRFHTW